MLRAIQQLGDALDRCDAAGWLLLLTGIAVLTITVLAPSWLEVRELTRQNRTLARQARLLDQQHENYTRLVGAVRRNDPLLIQRIAWRQLHVKPPGGRPLAWYAPGSAETPPPFAQWVRPPAVRLDPDINQLHASPPDTRLARLILGPTRPWVLAFGVWLVLLGLMINPSPHRRTDP